jgi:hypothetical protein
MHTFRSFQTLENHIRRRGLDGIPDAFKCQGKEWVMYYYDMAGQVIWYGNTQDSDSIGIWTKDRYSTTKDAEVVTDYGKK